MRTRYSTCHFAEVIYTEAVTKDFKRTILPSWRCSFCGKNCELVPMPFTVKHDVELTLRRWKDGDCSLEEMFDRLNEEYRRAWNEVFELAQKRLQKGKTPKHTYDPSTMSWQPTPKRAGRGK